MWRGCIGLVKVLRRFTLRFEGFVSSSVLCERHRGADTVVGFSRCPPICAMREQIQKLTAFLKFCKGIALQLSILQ